MRSRIGRAEGMLRLATMKFWRLEFSVLGLLLTVLLASLFSGLGRWQLERMHEKRVMDRELVERTQLPLAELPRAAAITDDLEAWRYRAVRIEGTPLAARQFLLDNEVRNGLVGFSVLTPFALDDGAVVVVDRGWVPIGASRRELPQVPLGERRRRVEGRVYVPFGEPFSLGDDDAQTDAWPRVIPHLDFDAIARHLGLEGLELLPLVIRMDATAEDGYLRNWPAIPFSADKHLAYAVQWFALALAVVVIFVLLNFNRKVAKWW